MKQTLGVYIVDVGLKILYAPDISQGKTISGGLLSLSSGSALDSPEMIKRYYDEYYLKKQTGLDYTVNKQWAAVSLLGYNLAARREFESINKKPLPQELLSQSFKTVGNAYKPILDNTTGVLTP